MAELKCPKCGSESEFKSMGFIEYHECVVDGEGCWVEDLDCYYSEMEDDPDMECMGCGFEGRRHDFAEAAETASAGE